MNLKQILFTMLISITTAMTGQSKLIVPANIQLPKDTIVANNLLKSLNGFLSEKEKPNKENTFVLNEDLLETSILIDEIKEIEKSVRFKDDNFYKGCINNIAALDKSNFLIQFSYIGVNENTPILAASFEILAKQKEDKFYFSSPIKRNTISWQTKTIENCAFHYKKTLNLKTATDYVKAVALFDKKLNAPKTKIEWYGCNDMPDLLQTIGVKYKADYNGRDTSTFSAKENSSLLIVNGENNISFESFDPHDLWHDRLRNVLSRSITNKPVDEGCAYLYGGSWGISWTQILKTFKEKVSSNPKIDWLLTYEDFYNFGESQEKHLLVPYVINALIVDKIEKEKGFTAVMEFLACGKFQKGNENYFKTLEKLTGINRANYNDNVWELIHKSGK